MMMWSLLLGWLIVDDEGGIWNIFRATYESHLTFTSNQNWPLFSSALKSKVAGKMIITKSKIERHCANISCCNPPRDRSCSLWKGWFVEMATCSKILIERWEACWWPFKTKQVRHIKYPITWKRRNKTRLNQNHEWFFVSHCTAFTR